MPINKLTSHVWKHSDYCVFSAPYKLSKKIDLDIEAIPHWHTQQAHLFDFFVLQQLDKALPKGVRYQSENCPNTFASKYNTQPSLMIVYNSVNIFSTHPSKFFWWARIQIKIAKRKPHNHSGGWLAKTGNCLERYG